MAEPEQTGVERALGRIEGRLDGIDHRLESAEQSRKEMYRRFAEVAGMRHDIGDLTKRVGAMEEQMKRSLVVTDRVEAYERDGKRVWSIAVGAGSMAGGLLKRVMQVGGLAVLAFWREIIDYFSGR